MDLQQLQTFREVARTLSFTRAAETLNYAQSTVTGHIKRLEEELGVPLFERLGKRVALTEAGQRLIPYAERVAHLMEEAQALIPGDWRDTSRLIIGAPESLCTYRLPRVLLPFHYRYRTVQMVFHAGFRDELGRAVRDGRLDAAFFIDELSAFPGLVVEPLVSERMLLLTSPDNPLARLARVEPAALEGQPILVSEAGCGYRRLFESALEEAHVRVETTLSFSSVEAMKQCIMAGMGVALLPEVTVAAEVAQGRLAPLAWAGKEFQVVTQMVWHKDKWLSPALRAFLDLAREQLIPPSIVQLQEG